VWHAMLRFSPSESTFSCVFAFTFTTSSPHPSSLARFDLMAALCGLIFGLVVAVQVEFESKGLKPADHFIGSRVE
jgi:hypothetical protein